MTSLFVISGLVVGAGCLFYLYYSSKQTDSPVQKTALLPSEKLPFIVGDRFLILDSQQLVEVLDLNPLLANIKTNLGLSDENWRKDAVPFLNNYIEFVQRLPASESHHHAGDGGLVKHTLDVAALALIASTAQSWPPNAKTEDIAKKTAVWRFGIMCAAILHDVGKTITGFNIQLFDSATDHDKTIWLPDAGAMPVTGKRYYRVEFPDAKTAYSSHAEIAWTFFQALVPAHVRQWIASTDPNLMITLRTYLSGKKDGNPFEHIITGADMASVARDLKAGSRQRFATAKRTPLIETVMDTLREMLSERGSYFSIATSAGGDVFHVGNYIYMMSKNVPDYIRQYLRSTQNRAAPSFPSDNQRIFDTLLEYGAVIPAEQDPHRAVINVAITFTRSDGQKVSGVYTMLRFKTDMLYPDGNLPETFKGELNITSEARISKSESLKTDAVKENTVTVEAEPNLVSVQPPVSHLNAAPKADAASFLANSVQADGNRAEVDAESDISVLEAKHVPNIEDNCQRPSETKATGLGGIDALLATHNLLDAPEGLDDMAVGKKDDADVILNKLNTATTKSKQTTKTDSSPRIAKKTVGNAVKAKPAIKGRAGLQVLNSIFEAKTADKNTETKIPEQSVTVANTESIPVFETAQEGIIEIIKDRMSAPLHTPRPVNINQVQGLDTVTQQIEVAVLASEMAEDRLKEQKDKDIHDSDVTSPLEERKLETREKGIQFLHWLANGMADGSISINRNSSPIHFIEQGMLLVTPAIFRDYAGGVFNKSDPESFGPQAQKGFEALKLHKRTKRTALFRAITAGTSKRLFYCYLIPEYNIKHIIQPSSRPANNTDITLDDSDLLMMEKE